MDATYHNIGNPAAYGGVSRVARATGKSEKITKRKLLQNATYRRFFRKKTKFDRAQLSIASMAHVFQADLFDFQKYAHANRGYHYILLVVDCFSRYIKAEPLKRKSAKPVAAALENIFISLRDEGRLGFKSMLGTDLGNEFWNKEADVVYEKFDVHHYGLLKPKKASLAEISGRYLLDRIYKHMYTTKENKWVEHLSKFVEAKNTRSNRTLGDLAPSEVTLANQSEIYKKLNSKRAKPEVPLKIGTKVNLALDVLPFHKSFHGYFSEKVYEVVRAVSYAGVFRFTVKDLSDGAILAGSYYAQELLPIVDDVN